MHDQGVTILEGHQLADHEAGTFHAAASIAAGGAKFAYTSTKVPMQCQVLSGFEG